MVKPDAHKGKCHGELVIRRRNNPEALKCKSSGGS
jgi:hypothetical protein